jgi:hypothetical protein
MWLFDMGLVDHLPPVKGQSSATINADGGQAQE